MSFTYETHMAVHSSSFKKSTLSSFHACEGTNKDTNEARHSRLSHIPPGGFNVVADQCIEELIGTGSDVLQQY